MARVGSAVLLAVNLAWSALMVACPFLVPAESARGLDGSATLLDNAELWRTYAPVPALGYALGDLNCHQMDTRSFHLNGNQLPVDARLTGIFLAANAGLFAALLAPQRPNASDVLPFLVPRRLAARLGSPRRRLAALATVLGAAVAPAFLDATLQLVTAYESTNLMRVATGAWFGLGVAFVAALVFDALFAPTAE